MTENIREETGITTPTQETPLSADGPEINAETYAITILILVGVAGIIITALSCYYRYRIRHVTPGAALIRQGRRTRAELGLA
jgi:hypothetical protein